ncbi:MAG: hypothetical protein KKF44_08770 [Nanoarchaeota archaeon]|nr:hypothetical protein [Nanoarchaeota archaeon]
MHKKHPFFQIILIISLVVVLSSCLPAPSSSAQPELGSPELSSPQPNPESSAELEPELPEPSPTPSVELEPELPEFCSKFTASGILSITGQSVMAKSTKKYAPSLAETKTWKPSYEYINGKKIIS